MQASADIGALGDEPHDFMLILCEKKNGVLHNIKMTAMNNISSAAGSCKISTDKMEIGHDSDIDAYIWDSNMRPYNTQFTVVK